MRYEKHFTVEEAQRELAEIAPTLKELVALKKSLDVKGFDVYRHQYFGGIGPNGQKAFPVELERLAEIAKELDNRGIVLKGIDTGLIDFPHIRANGKEAYLCYECGETRIMYWHELDDGFAGRQPLRTL